MITTPYSHGAALVTTAFDTGITHVDNANNCGPPPCSAEEIVPALGHRCLETTTRYPHLTRKGRANAYQLITTVMLIAKRWYHPS